MKDHSSSKNDQKFKIDSSEVFFNFEGGGIKKDHKKKTCFSIFRTVVIVPAEMQKYSIPLNFNWKLRGYRIIARRRMNMVDTSFESL